MRSLIAFLAVKEETGGGVDCKVVRKGEWIGFVDSLDVGGRRGEGRDD